jgi:hypothetical protein
MKEATLFKATNACSALAFALTDPFFIVSALVTGARQKNHPVKSSMHVSNPLPRNYLVTSGFSHCHHLQVTPIGLEASSRVQMQPLTQVLVDKTE